MHDSTTHHDHDYLPPCGHHDHLLPFYDLLSRVMGAQGMHRTLVDAVGIRAGDDVLDVGTGTGGLALLIAATCPGARVIGVDPDRRSLDRARRKAARVGGAVRFEHGYGEALPVDDARVDHVVSAFAFHHMAPETKSAALREVRRALRPGGSVVLMDFGGRMEPGDGFVARRALRQPLLQDNLGDAIPRRMREAGLVDAVEVGHRVSVRVGRVTIWRASRDGAVRPSDVVDAGPQGDGQPA